MTDKELFWDHLAKSSHIVDEWPEWKKLGMNWSSIEEIADDEDDQETSSSGGKKNINNKDGRNLLIAKQMLNIGQ